MNDDAQQGNKTARGLESQDMMNLILVFFFRFDIPL
jgi:hypothetical protein